VIFTRVAAIAGFLAVALGAFGAHGLRARLGLGGGLEIWKTAALYHLIHAVALLAVALAAARLRAPRAVCWLFLAGIVLFSGSLYLLALTGVGTFGAITPVGGAAFLSGWMVLAVTGVKG
jgi:uncharacterized membrane protein YgdD (TMEM256/DUF423 family)